MRSHEDDAQKTKEQIASWLFLTRDAEIPLGLDQQEARRRATTLLYSILDDRAAPESFPVNEEAKQVLSTIVTLLAEAPSTGEERLREANQVYQFIARLDWPDDSFGEKQDLLAECAEIGWRAVGLTLAEVSRGRNGDSPPTPLAETRARAVDAIREAEAYLQIPIAQRQPDLIEGTLSRFDVLFAVCRVLRERRDTLPASAAMEADAAYRWVAASDRRIDLFDERDHFLGEVALVAGVSLRILGKREEAVRWLDRAEASFRHTVDSTSGLSRVAYARLSLRQETGQYEDVLDLVPSVIASFRQLGMPVEEGKGRFLQAEALKKTGRLAEAMAILEEMCDESAIRRNPPLFGQVLIQIGEHHALEGRTAEALRCYQEALPIIQLANRPIVAASLKLLMGETLRIQNRLPAALAVYREARQDFGALQMVTWVAYVHVLSSEVLLVSNRHREAELEILAALPTIEEQKMVPEGFAAVALLKESVRRRKTDPNALRELREHLKSLK